MRSDPVRYLTRLNLSATGLDADAAKEVAGALAANLKPHTSEDAPFLTAKLPAEKDLTFWGSVAVECMPDEAKETSEADLGAALANAVHCELGSRDVTLVDKGLWIGDLSVPESCAAQFGGRTAPSCAAHSS